MSQKVYDTCPHYTPGEPNSPILVRCSRCQKPVETRVGNYGAVFCSGCEPIVSCVREYAPVDASPFTQDSLD